MRAREMAGRGGALLTIALLTGCFVDLSGPEVTIEGLDWLRFETVVQYDASDASGVCRRVFPRMIGGPGPLVTLLSSEVIRLGDILIPVGTLYHPGGGHPTRVCDPIPVVEIEYPDLPRFGLPERIFRIPTVVRTGDGRIRRDAEGGFELPLHLPDEGDISVPQHSTWSLEVQPVGGGVRLTLGEQGAGYLTPGSYLDAASLASLPDDRPLQFHLSLVWSYSRLGSDGLVVASWHSTSNLSWESEPEN